MSYAISGNVASMSRKYEPPFRRGRWYNIHCQGYGAGDTGEQKTTSISKFLQRTSPVDRLAEGRFSVYRCNVNKRFVFIRSNKLDSNR